MDTEEIPSIFGKRKETQIKKPKDFVTKERKRNIYELQRLLRDFFLGTQEFKNKILK